jgi:hypothetical protein
MGSYQRPEAFSCSYYLIRILLSPQHHLQSILKMDSQHIGSQCTSNHLLPLPTEVQVGSMVAYTMRFIYLQYLLTTGETSSYNFTTQSGGGTCSQIPRCMSMPWLQSVQKITITDNLSPGSSAKVGSPSIELLKASKKKSIRSRQ